MFMCHGYVKVGLQQSVGRGPDFRIQARERAWTTRELTLLLNGSAILPMRSLYARWTLHSSASHYDNILSYLR
jgi:hypothetical protein